MATSRAQGDKNVRDVNNAWGHFQALFQQHYPANVGLLSVFARIANTKRRYTV